MDISFNGLFIPARTVGEAAEPDQWQYLQHTLPHGFMKVRHFGFMASNAKVPLEKIRELICALYEILIKLLPKPKPPQRKPWTCKTCGGLIRWREYIPCPRGIG